MIKRFQHGYLLSFKNHNNNNEVQVMNIYHSKLNDDFPKASGVIADKNHKALGFDILSWWIDE